MQRFQINDSVLILPKFAHLYPALSAVVIGVNTNLFRPMFNECNVKFADGSTAKLFEFQLIEDATDYTTLIAGLVVDTDKSASMPQVRGHASGRQIVLQTSGFDIDMRIGVTKSRAFVVGQVLERDTKRLLANLDVRLMKEGMPIGTDTSDSLGVFAFNDVSRGSLNILVVIPQYMSRILGTFSV